LKKAHSVAIEDEAELGVSMEHCDDNENENNVAEYNCDDDKSLEIIQGEMSPSLLGHLRKQKKKSYNIQAMQTKLQWSLMSAQGRILH
jgi:hypothetical protein